MEIAALHDTLSQSSQTMSAAHLQIIDLRRILEWSVGVSQLCPVNQIIYRSKIKPALSIDNKTVSGSPMVVG